MKVEQLIPKGRTAEILGISLGEIYGQIKNLSQEELINGSREFVIKGNIKAGVLREIRKLGIEFSVSGEKGRLVFGTGGKETVEPNLDLYLREKRYLDDTYPSPVKRYAEVTYSMHSHDSEYGIVPSLADLEVMEHSKNESSLLFTAKGILQYTWDKTLDLNVRQEFRAFVDAKYPEYSLYGHKASTITTEELMTILKDFASFYNVILRDVPWEDIEDCQRLIDTYFEQFPPVILIENPSQAQKESKGTMRSMDFKVQSGNDEIGTFTLNIMGKPGDEGYGYIQTIKLGDNFRGPDKNYSKAVWLAVIDYLRKDGKFLSNEWSLTKGADKVWQWLVENNYAIVIKEGVRDEANKGPGYSTFQYKSIV